MVYKSFTLSHNGWQGKPQGPWFCHRGFGCYKVFGLSHKSLGLSHRSLGLSHNGFGLGWGLGWPRLHAV